LKGYGDLAPAERADRIAQALAALAGATPSSPSAARPPFADGRSVAPPVPQARAPGESRVPPPLSPPSQPLPPRPDERARSVDQQPAPVGVSAPVAPARKRRAARPRTEPPTAADRVGSGLDTPVGRLKGVGPANVRRLDRLGIATVRDLLAHYPHRHLDYSKLKKVAELEPGELTTVVVTVWDVGSFQTRRGFERIEAVTGDETGNLLAVWFRRKDYFGSKLRGRQVVLSGRVESRGGRLYLNDPEIEFLEQADLVSTARLVPVYHLTEGLNQRWLRGLAKAAVDRYAPMLEEHLPPAIREQHRLLPLTAAVQGLHFPEDEVQLARSRRRLAFDELFVIQLGVAQRKRAWRQSSGAPELALDEPLRRTFEQTLPFALTGAQRRALEQILADLAHPQPMGRLLQGDVGAGKTVVAALAMLAAVGRGQQAVLMAPTEILAEQHYRTLSRLLGAEPLRDLLAERRGRPGPEVRLLVGSTRGAARREATDGAADGTVDVLVGTHAVIQERVALASLGLAVVDEQHRFGVLQRSALRQKGFNPHVLVMTATPIPRTLALTLYGELDLSIIDELPPGRSPVKTRWVAPDKRRGAYEFVRREVQAGRQAFVVCPLVEESENVAARAATAEYERLAEEVFPELRLGLIHGRMPAAEKDAAMRAFRDHETQVLVATAVIEVGIDIPNASVMLIEAAERFGLAQLHQLRGRVGRGAHQSYCILLSEQPSLDGEERLRVIEETTDGFRLAEEDLRIRGPGEFLGTRQSGLPDLKVASLGDLAMIEEARQSAFALVEADPELARPEHRLLAARLAALPEPTEAA
jgi:ATP-dependent DNA helicase RecG